MIYSKFGKLKLKNNYHNNINNNINYNNNVITKIISNNYKNYIQKRNNSGKEDLERRKRIAEEHYSDFTIQYPPRREYFKEKFPLPFKPTLSSLLTSPSNFKYSSNLSSHLSSNSFSNSTSNSTLIKTSSEIEEKKGEYEEEYEKRLLLYCHIPFCEQKCFYCNFAVDTRKAPELHEKYVSSLEQSLSSLSHFTFPSDDQTKRKYEIRGIDIGGGTPTAIATPLLQRVVRSLRPFRTACSHSFPLSIETTPSIVCKSPDRIEMLKEEGVNRVSMGLQSTNENILNQLNRGIQSPNLSIKAISYLKSLNFDRISCDIIFGLPNQTMKMWEIDLQTIVDSPTDVVTTYDCLYRGKGRAMTNRSAHIPSRGLYGEMYDFGYDYLTKKGGFKAPYGSVNFSRREGETGTSAYFEGRLLDGYQYVGVGNYASSYCGSNWFFAPYHVDQWIDDIQQREVNLNDQSTVNDRVDAYFPINDCYDLPWEEMAAKYLLLTLSFGVIDPSRFYRMFKRNFEEEYAEQLKFAFQHDYLWKSEKDGNYYITYGKFKDMPIIRSLFYSKSAIDWLLHIKENPSSLRAYKNKEKKEDGINN